MVPYAQHSPHPSQRHQFHVPTYSHPMTSYDRAEASYQSLNSLPYRSDSIKTLTPLQTSVDYKKNVNFPIVSKKTLPSVATTSFQQYFSPGLEYHYTEAVPVYPVNYQPNYMPETPSFDYYKSYVPSSVPVSQQNNQYESFLPKQYQQTPQHPDSQLFTHMFSRPMYNTIQYSVQLPPYEHKKRSTSKTSSMNKTTLSMKTPKA